MDEPNGKPMKAPPPFSGALPWVRTTPFQDKSGDVTNKGWHPSMSWPKPRGYFDGHGRHNTKAENDAAPSLGNKWRKK